MRNEENLDPPFSDNAHTICLPISEPSLSFVAANDSLNNTIEFDVISSAISLILLSSSSNFPLFMVASSSRPTTSIKDAQILNQLLPAEECEAPIH